MVWSEGARGRACECSNHKGGQVTVKEERVSGCSLGMGIGEAPLHRALTGPSSAPFRPYLHPGLAAGVGKMGL